MSDDLLGRFLAKVRYLPCGGCWEWQAMRQDGYGRFTVKRRVVKAHRWSYEHFIGPIPDGKPLDHLCRNRACVNPLHLEPVTPQENSRRSPLVGRALMAHAAVRASATHCVNGHPYDEDNVYRPDGYRHCRRCRAAAQQRYRERKAASQ